MAVLNPFYAGGAFGDRDGLQKAIQTMADRYKVKVTVTVSQAYMLPTSIMEEQCVTFKVEDSQAEDSLAPKKVRHIAFFNALLEVFQHICSTLRMQMRIAYRDGKKNQEQFTWVFEQAPITGRELYEEFLANSKQGNPSVKGTVSIAFRAAEHRFKTTVPDRNRTSSFI